MNSSLRYCIVLIQLVNKNCIESESKTAELIKSLKYKVVNFKKKITSLQKTIDEQNEVIWNLKDKLKKNCETAEEITGYLRFSLAKIFFT